MKFTSRDQLPKEHLCRKCERTKPIDEMIVIRQRSTGHFLLRARCKACYNKQERGHRREYKTKYLRLWRQRNPEVSESYWRQHAQDNRQRINALAERRRLKLHEALLIQGRLQRHGIKTSIAQAKALLKKYGRCYPTRFGLTLYGMRECERVRSAQRRCPASTRFSPLEIRMMVYEDGYYKRPSRQPIPYAKSAEKLRRYQAQCRQAKQFQQPRAAEAQEAFA